MTLGKCFFYFLFTCCFLQIKGINIDYYFGFDDPLRSEDTCFSVHGQKICDKLCGDRITLCSGHGKCYCVESEYRTGNGEMVIASRARRQSPDRRGYHIGDIDFGDDYFGLDFDAASLRSGPPPHPDKGNQEFDKSALRHHIAHFCPNLEIARKCIRKCMKTGQPAFCGKDHVCYCGHKYSSKDIDVVKDPKKVYGGFQDLYAKYFGKNEDSSEENKSGEKSGKSAEEKDKSAKNKDKSG